jgi:hypothetical protein
MRSLFEWLARLGARVRDSKRVAEYSSQQKALLDGVAQRLTAQVGAKNGRQVVRRDGVDVEVTFIQSEGMIQTLIWRTTVPPPGLPNFEIYKRGTVVSAADDVVMQQLFTPERRERLARDLMNLEVWCEDNRLQIRLRPAVLYQNVIDGAFELMFGLVTAHGVFR